MYKMLLVEHRFIEGLPNSFSKNFTGQNIKLIYCTYYSFWEILSTNVCLSNNK